MALCGRQVGMKKQNHIENTGEAEVQLVDFVIPSKITAFCNQYTPIREWKEGCDTFTDYQLRSYFKAVVCPLGDPLSIYLQELEMRGFSMHNDVCGEPVIYAMPK